MVKRILLVSCSAIATYMMHAAASAQTMTPDAATGIQTAPPTTPAMVPQDAPTNPATIKEETPVPGNSDAAEDQKVREAVEAREQETDPGQAGERRRMQVIRDLRKAGAAALARSPSDETITVTGSRLKQGDVTSRLTVIDAEEIRARGVTSVEELIRTLPQNVATIGAITNDRSRGPLRDSNNRPLTSGIGALGVAAANLGGVGAGNTLVLVNGRRIAGAAGIEQGYANLNGIPLSAIERVEISTEGASSIYGADALGGVINFILRKNYVGTTISAQHQYSSGGADNSRINVYSGYAWGSGNISGTIDYSRREPIVNRRTGYVTNNYAPFFDGNPIYDRRTFDAGRQPGVIVRPAVFDPDTFDLITPETALTVPNGFSGAPTAADFIRVGLNEARDFVPTFAGPRSRTISGTLTGEQNVTDRLRIFANGLYSRTRNSQESSAAQGIRLLLAPGQFYNPFAAFEISPFSAGTEVAYFPGAEIADGTLDAGFVSNVTEAWSVNAGIGYDVNRDTKIELVYTRSSSRTKGNTQDIGNLVTNYIENPDAPGTYACFNDLLANNLLPASQLAAYQAAFDRQCRALTSTDAATAFNPWKSTSGGGGASIADFLHIPLTDDLGATLQTFEGRMSGQAFKLPGGTINYAVGGEYGRNTVSSENIRAITGENGATSRYAFFAETTIPVVGREFTLPLVRRLTFNISARHDVTNTEGAIGTIDNIPIDQGGEIIYGKNRFGRTTPAFGVLWSPFNNLDVRAKFTRGFKAPPPTQLFTTLGSSVTETVITDDPLYTCTTDCLPDTNGRSYAVPARTAPNPGLMPETSQQMVVSGSWQPTGFLSGLNLALTYNRNRIRNQFATLRDLFRFLPASEIMRLEQFYPRDASGKIISEQNMRFNVIGSNFESLAYEASYLFDTGVGSFQPKATVIQNIVAENIGTEREFVVSQRGRILGVDKYRLVGSLQWNKGPVSANLFVYHIPGYLNDYQSVFSAGEQLNPELVTRVRALTTVDFSLSWVATNKLAIQLAGRNILKAKPPFTVVDSLPYDTSRYDVAGRTVQVSAQYSF